MLYKKPEIRSYGAGDIVEEMGSCQSQYTATFYTTTGNSSVNVDGDIDSSGTVVTDDYISPGDDNADLYRRGFFGFDISSIQGRTIVSATLRIYQAAVTGTPYGGINLGNLLVDHVNFGNSLDSGDFNAAPWTSNIGTISDSATPGWKTLDVANYVQADLNASRTSSQYRTRFTTDTDSDGVNDFASFESAENSGSTGYRPELVVTYR